MSPAAWTIGPASLDDLDAIEALEAAAFTGDRLSRRSLRGFIRAPRRPLIVARFGERVAGYALHVDARGRPHGAHLFARRRSPPRRAAASGARCCRPASATRAAHGREALRLEVRYDNPAAIALYEKTRLSPVRSTIPATTRTARTALRFEKRAGRRPPHATAA